MKNALLCLLMFAVVGANVLNMIERRYPTIYSKLSVRQKSWLWNVLGIVTLASMCALVYLEK